jgi:hypothetical protein
VEKGAFFNSCGIWEDPLQVQASSPQPTLGFAATLSDAMHPPPRHRHAIVSCICNRIASTPHLSPAPPSARSPARKLPRWGKVALPPCCVRNQRRNMDLRCMQNTGFLPPTLPTTRRGLPAGESEDANQSWGLQAPTLNLSARLFSRPLHVILMRLHLTVDSEKIRSFRRLGQVSRV